MPHNIQWDRYFLLTASLLLTIVTSAWFRAGFYYMSGEEGPGQPLLVFMVENYFCSVLIGSQIIFWCCAIALTETYSCLKWRFNTWEIQNRAFGRNSLFCVWFDSAMTEFPEIKLLWGWNFFLLQGKDIGNNGKVNVIRNCKMFSNNNLLLSHGEAPLWDGCRRSMGSAAVGSLRGRALVPSAATTKSSAWACGKINCLDSLALAPLPCFLPLCTPSSELHSALCHGSSSLKGNQEGNQTWSHC